MVGSDCLPIFGQRTEGNQRTLNGEPFRCDSHVVNLIFCCFNNELKIDIMNFRALNQSAVVKEIFTVFPNLLCLLFIVFSNPSKTEG